MTRAEFKSELEEISSYEALRISDNRVKFAARISRLLRRYLNDSKETRLGTITFPERLRFAVSFHVSEVRAMEHIDSSKLKELIAEKLLRAVDYLQMEEQFQSEFTSRVEPVNSVCMTLDDPQSGTLSFVFHTLHRFNINSEDTIPTDDASVEWLNKLYKLKDTRRAKRTSSPKRRSLKT
jgi:hypothetical protein